MPTRLHQEPSRKPGYTAARMAAFPFSGLWRRKTLAPVAVALFGRKDAAHAIEKDGTGIGTGSDTERQPALGAWSGLAQDVLMEHGRSRTLIAHAFRWQDATEVASTC